MNIVEAKPTELPDPGVYRGTLVAINDLPPKPDRFGNERVKTKFTWKLRQLNSRGEPFKLVQSYTKTLNVKSYLFKAVSQILGHSPGDRFDLDTLMGIERNLVVQHTKLDDDRTFANIVSFLPVTATRPPEDRTRPADEPSLTINDSDIPF